MINYGIDKIFENRSLLQSFQKWAALASPQNLTPPTQDQINAGVLSMNTYPAPWHNSYNQEYTVNLTMIATLVLDLYTELLSVLAEGNVTPSQNKLNQLRDSLKNIINLHIAEIGDSTVDFTPATTGKALASGDTLATLFSKLAFWRSEWAPKSHSVNNGQHGVGTEDIEANALRGHLGVLLGHGLKVKNYGLLEHDDSSGWGHIPSGGTPNAVLTYNSDGKAKWSYQALFNNFRRQVIMTSVEQLFTWQFLGIPQDSYILFLQVVDFYAQIITAQYSVEAEGIRIWLDANNVNNTIIRKWGAGNWGDGIWAEEDSVTVNLLITKL